jgi:hypothetical protein
MKAPRRIPKSNITRTRKPALDKNSPDLFWVSPDEAQVFDGDQASYEGYLTTTSSKESAFTGLNNFVSSTNITPSASIEKIDTVDLTNIEGDPVYEQYYDPVSKLVRYKVTLKIRNASINKSKVQGVDARVYNPGA